MRAPGWITALALLALAAPASATVTVGSKAFPESWILGEALALEMRAAGVPDVFHRHNLGGTQIVYQGLRSGAVDVYAEYTGTLLEVILHETRALPLEAIRERLRAQGLGMSEPLGFEDSYAIAVSDAAYRRDRLRTLSDLARHPELRLGLTHEFLGRPDGYPGLARRYGLRMRSVSGIEHELAYGALAAGRIEATDVYTTDAQIERLGLHVLQDDRRFFPRYQAVWLYRLDVAEREPRALAAMNRFAARVDEQRMMRANGMVVLDGRSYQEAAAMLMAETLGRAAPPAGAPAREIAGAIGRNTARHLQLVVVSLLAAVLIGVPLGVAAERFPPVAGAILGATGLVQTIPSLALLAVLIPLFGIGAVPALIALFLYGLLPVVRNTYVGLTTIPPPLSEAATAIGLSPAAQLFRVRLPMASPAIMAGIKTSAVITVGTATLAALIGAGGLGEPILSGIQLRRTGLILQGALPAAVLALGVQAAFDLLDRVVIPRGLRLPATRE